MKIEEKEVKKEVIYYGEGKQENDKCWWIESSRRAEVEMREETVMKKKRGSKTVMKKKGSKAVMKGKKRREKEL